MSRRMILMGSVAASPLLMVCPDPYEYGGWYGAIDAGYHLIGDLERVELVR